MATNFPAKYFDVQGMPQPSAGAGGCLLKVTDTMVRPKIGGGKWKPPHIQRRRRTQKRKVQKRKAQTRKAQKRQQGGFLPSIGEPFAAAAAKYIAPLALFGLYRFLNPTKKAKSGKRSTRRRT